MLSHYREAALIEIKKFFKHLVLCLRWILISIFVGIVMGTICAAFSHALSFVTGLRMEHGGIIWLLPIAGLLITFIYQKFGKQVAPGTNMALAAINSDEKIPFRMLPIIFITSIISHMFGASVGREGAALQMGASFGNTCASAFKLDDNDRKILIMAGMSAAFSALFGTPLAAAIFSIEVISVGVMYYAALVPCIVSSLISINIAKLLGVTYIDYSGLLEIPKFTPFTATMTAVLGVLCAVLSIVLCVTLILSERIFVDHIKNPYVRILVAGLMIAILTFLVGSQDYNGLGSMVLQSAVAGKAVWYAFILKAIYTVISLSGGYKGGEIVPVLFIGATFGCTISSLVSMPPEFCAALGMLAVFCGVTNTPLATMIIGVELFGSGALGFFCLVIAISYMLSGYYSLYKSQLIIYSKYKSVYVHKSAKR